jgi:uncharacterized protein YabE (DUF348 family)
VRPSPARAEAPEPDVWFPILSITAELDALDITAELEELDLDVGRAHFDAELTAHETDFWSSAPNGLEAAVARIRFVEPEAPELPLMPALLELVDTLAPAPVAPVAPEAPEVHDDAEATAPSLSLRARLLLALRGTDFRTRLVGTLLVLALVGALATVFPSVVGASVPQRYVTITLDGTTVARTVRLATVGDVLAHETILVHPGDQVIPTAATELREGMHIHVLRSFPVDVEVDGVVTTLRTTRRTPGALRHDLGIGSALVATTPARLAAGSTIAFRTPHAVTLKVDGTTINAPRSTALDVAGLLTDRGIALGPRDEVTPAANTRLANGMNVEVFRLADNQVAERVAVPFTTETRDDPNLPVGQTRMIQAGVAGLRRDLYQVTTRDDGSVVARTQIGSELLTPPVAQVVVKGTQPLPPSASGSATWYGTAPGRGTCAHLSLKFGTIVTLTNRATGATAQCRVADRGPEAWTGHIIDLAPDVFRRLAPLSQGVISVALSY